MSIIKIKDIDIEKLLEELEANAWYNKGIRSTAYLICGKDVVKLHGYTYEPYYELFSTTHTITLNGERLFKEGDDTKLYERYHKPRIYKDFKNTEEIISFLQNHFKDKEIILRYDEPNIQNQEQEDEEEAES